MDPLERLDVVVVGGGVIGLAVARAFSLADRQVVLLEAEPVLGSHTSSRSSEVIHAGIYYAPGSLKAALCVAGRQALYAYCEASGVPHARSGKLIVAVHERELPVLDELVERARANGVLDLERLTGREVAALEPAVNCVAGVLSPSTGIVDSHALMGALRLDAERAGAHVVVRSPVLSGRVLEDGFELSIGGPEASTVRCRTLVNAAGLWAQQVARTISGIPEASIPACFYAKGHYFVLSCASPFSRLVYPVPLVGGLGVHVTLDLAGRARFGPDVSWVDSVDYAFDDSRAGEFLQAIQRYFPAVDPATLQPGYTGVRPKLGPANSGVHDFMVQGPSEHGVPELVNLYGIESPGLTCALALADRARALLG
jgi:L-2-hydroxyglutarate oxidase LhgO